MVDRGGVVAAKRQSEGLPKSVVRPVQLKLRFHPQGSLTRSGRSSGRKSVNKSAKSSEVVDNEPIGLANMLWI